MKGFAKQKTRHGLSQIEVVVSLLLVGLVLVTAMNVLAGSVRTNGVAADLLDAPGLAHQLMGEILAMPYEDPEEPGGPIALDTGETNTTRAQFDDLDDYDNWTRMPPEMKDGTPVPGATDWQRQVFVKHYDPTTGSTSGSTETGVKFIRVIVTPPGGVETEIHALRSNWGSLQQPPAVDTTTVTSIDAQLQIGASSSPAISSTHLKNHAND